MAAVDTAPPASLLSDKENEKPSATEPQSNGAAKVNGPPVTVLHNKDEFNVIHPLMHEWTLWFTKPPSGKGDNWNELLKEVVTFGSVEEFWGIYNNITPTSELAVKSDYHLFKKGVRPEWEDLQNKHGGKWAYQFKDKRTAPIDDSWLYMMLAAIGETLEKDENDGEVMGVVVNVRKSFFRIGLWTKTVGKAVPNGGTGDVAGGKGRSPEKSKGSASSIGRKFKDVLGVKDSEQVEFTGHSDAATAGSTRAKPKLTV